MPVRKNLTPRQKMLKAVIRHAQQSAYTEGYKKAKDEEVPWMVYFVLGLLIGLAVSFGFLK